MGDMNDDSSRWSSADPAVSTTGRAAGRPAPATSAHSYGSGATQTPVPTFRWYPRLTRLSDRGVIGGVAAGVALHLGVRVALVRAAFALLAVISGVGIGIYAGLWVITPAVPAGPGVPAMRRGERRSAVLLAVLGAAGALLSVLGATSTSLVVLAPVVIVTLGSVLVWREVDRGVGTDRRSATEWARVTAGSTLVVVGLAVAVLGQVEMAALRSSMVAVLATLVGVGLLSVPLWMRLWRSLELERAERIRQSERSDIASHLHDSVLQTLALIQKHSADPVQVSRLARRQERELRQWLFGSDDRMSGGADTVAGVVEAICGDIEDAYGLRVDQVVVGGSRGIGEREEAALGAVREALVNVAKHAGVSNADVFVEVDEGMLSAFVRDRGCGFDPDEVGEDRQGLTRSIRHRVESRGGRVTVRSTLGRGTEIGVDMPLEES